MKRNLMIGLLVFLTISVGMLISCSGEIRYVDRYTTETIIVTNTDTDFVNYMMKSGDDWFNSFEALYPELNKDEITSITFTSDTSICEGLSWTDLTIEKSEKVKGYVSGTDIYIVGDKIYGNYDCSGMFSDYDNLKKINFGNFDTSKVLNMYEMISDCENLESIAFGERFITYNVTNMCKMFTYCPSLKTLNLSSFDTSNVKEMSYIFANNYKLESIEFGEKFVNSNVISIGGMFDYCSSLKTLEIDDFDTSNVGAMYYMFRGCSSLKALNLSGFNTANATSMTYMFKGCTSMTDLDLSKFTITSETDLGGMFDNCGYKDSTIEINDSMKTYWENNQTLLFKSGLGNSPWDSYTTKTDLQAGMIVGTYTHN